MQSSDSSQHEDGRFEPRKKRNEKYLLKIRGLTGGAKAQLAQQRADSAAVSKADSQTARKERNKLAAKNTRERKKVHTELMENKISELQMELKFIQDQVKLAKINRSTENMMKVIYGFKNLNQRECADPLATAKERIDIIRSSNIQIPERRLLIESHFEQFVEHTQTPFFRYFCSTAMFKKDFFSDGKPPSELCHHLGELLGLSHSQGAALAGLQPQFNNVGLRFRE